MAIASVRPAALAGQFYPREERVLRMQITEMLAAALPLEHAITPKAIIVPHAGYMYSGPVAASASRSATWPPISSRVAVERPSPTSSILSPTTATT